MPAKTRTHRKRPWGIAHMDRGIFWVARTRRECVAHMGYAGEPLRDAYPDGTYYYHAREGGHDVWIGPVRALLAAGFALEVGDLCAATEFLATVDGAR